MDFNLEQVPSQAGRIAIVTGANTGLGFETTVGLAGKGMQVVMACRNLEKAEKARADILEQIPDADLQVMQLDLGKLSSVRSFAEEFRKKCEKLDLLINNAGVAVPPYAATDDGFESQFGVNHLAHFLLTKLLIDMIPDSAESRVVSLSSLAHKKGRINFDDLQSQNKYSRAHAYAQSKLACLMFADELQRRLQANGKKILSTSAHPGASPTELARHVPSAVYAVARVTVLPFITHSAANGALPTLMAALSSDLEGGEYCGPQGFTGFKGKPGIARKADQVLDEAVAARLWQVSEELTGCSFAM